jgi:5-methyltetrahydrofolate--homocysteine methyltransferase
VFKNYDLAMIAKYIDWGPFFQTWDLHGPFPAILADEVIGEHARQVFAEGEKMLERAIRERWLQANAALAFYPANALGDDIEVYADESRSEVLFTWHGLRQQTKKPVHRRRRRIRTSACRISSRRSRAASPTIWGSSR